MNKKKSKENKNDSNDNYKEILRLQRFHDEDIISLRITEIKDSGDILISMNRYFKESGENENISMKLSVSELTLLEKVFSGLSDKKVSHMIFEI